MSYLSTFLAPPSQLFEFIRRDVYLLPRERRVGGTVARHGAASAPEVDISFEQSVFLAAAHRDRATRHPTAISDIGPLPFQVELWAGFGSLQLGQVLAATRNAMAYVSIWIVGKRRYTLLVISSNSRRPSFDRAGISESYSRYLCISDMRLAPRVTLCGLEGTARRWSGCLYYQDICETVHSIHCITHVHPYNWIRHCIYPDDGNFCGKNDFICSVHGRVSPDGRCATRRTVAIVSVVRG